MAAAMREAKQLLRREIKQRLAALSSDEKARQSDFILKKLISHPIYQRSSRVSVYLSTAEEVDTNGLLRHMFANEKKKCFVPQYIGARMDMLRLHSMEDYDALPLTKWKIKQPAEGDQREEALSTGGLDLIIVPGLAFTINGDRLGRGKGYYDKYQERCAKHPSGKPKTIALAFKEQICDKIPVTEDDVTIDYVLYGDME